MPWMVWLQFWLTYTSREGLQPVIPNDNQTVQLMEIKNKKKKKRKKIK